MNTTTPQVNALPRTYAVRTLGCQMNEHDSERMAGLLEQAGLVPVDTVPEAAARATDAGDMGADVIVINTCSVRENAATRLFGNLGQLAAVKRERPGMQIAVGGCLAQQMRDGIVSKAPWVDAVFGTHNIDVLPALLRRAEHNRKAAVEIEESLKVFPSTLPTHRESAFAAWVSISVGCNNTCTFCIVPHLRGKERDRRPGDILAEVEAVASQGAIEVTLLGQNVNSYGRDLYGEPRFADVLRAVDAAGIERLRFATSHPKDLTDEVIGLFATLPSLMPALHLPVQSGSNRILSAMNRRYTREHYLGLIEKLRRARPDIALSTDIIVGFPGETEEDFMDTYRLVEEVGYSQVFTFIYSKREGTPAAEMDDDTPREVIQERFDRLVDLVQRKAFEANQTELGATVPVLVEGTSKRDDSILAGKSPKNQTVHAPVPAGADAASLVGRIVPVTIEEARTWYLSGTIVHA